MSPEIQHNPLWNINDSVHWKEQIILRSVRKNENLKSQNNLKYGPIPWL